MFAQFLFTRFVSPLADEIFRTTWYRVNIFLFSPINNRLSFYFVVEQTWCLIFAKCSQNRRQDDVLSFVKFHWIYVYDTSLKVNIHQIGKYQEYDGIYLCYLMGIKSSKLSAMFYPCSFISACRTRRETPCVERERERVEIDASPQQKLCIPSLLNTTANRYASVLLLLQRFRFSNDLMRKCQSYCFTVTVHIPAINSISVPKIGRPETRQSR